VWFRVNEQLPVELQKHLPDGPAGAVNIRLQIAKLHAEGGKLPKYASSLDSTYICKSVRVS